jgi:hypothetical protein
VEVPVYALHEEAIAGLQFSMNMLSGLQLADVRPGQLNVTGDNFGWLNNRTLTASWSSAEAINVSNDQPLFTIVMQSNQALRLSEAIEMVAAPTQGEAYTATDDILDLNLTFRGAEEVFNFELLQNEPNPFTGRTEIGFVIPQSGEVILTMFDLTGKQLLNETIQGVKGLNKIEVTRDQIGAQGMVYYQVQFQGFTATKKMLIL